MLFLVEVERIRPIPTCLRLRIFTFYVHIGILGWSFFVVLSFYQFQTGSNDFLFLFNQFSKKNLLPSRCRCGVYDRMIACYGCPATTCLFRVSAANSSSWDHGGNFSSLGSKNKVDSCSSLFQNGGASKVAYLVLWVVFQIHRVPKASVGGFKEKDDTIPFLGL